MTMKWPWEKKNYADGVQHFFEGVVEEDRCPHCNADMRHTPIPYEIRWCYGRHQWFSRKLLRIWNDRAQDYTCPDCGGKWPAQ